MEHIMAITTNLRIYTTPFLGIFGYSILDYETARDHIITLPFLQIQWSR